MDGGSRAEGGKESDGAANLGMCTPLEAHNGRRLVSVGVDRLTSDSRAVRLTPFSYYIQSALLHKTYHDMVYHDLYI